MDVLNTKIKNIKDEKALKVRPENIKNGVSIFGIQGTYTGLDTSDANATAADIASGKTAYVNGTKLSGKVNLSSNYSEEATTMGVNNGYFNMGLTIYGGDDDPDYAVGVREGGDFTLVAAQEDVAEIIDLTADKIKRGETILGVTGTYGGITPTGTINITQNGTVDVSNYASANVNVSSGGGGSTFSIIDEIQEDYDEETGELIGETTYYWLQVNETNVAEQDTYTFDSQSVLIVNSAYSDHQFWSWAYDLGAVDNAWNIQGIMAFNNTSNTYRIYFTDFNHTRRVNTDFVIGPYSGFSLPSLMTYHITTEVFTREESIIPEFELITT